MPNRGVAEPRGERMIRGLGPAERSAQRRAALERAATDLFAEQGYTRTTIEHICQRAYVSTKGFYEHFASKEACLLAIQHDGWHRLVVEVMSAMDGYRDGAHHHNAQLIIRGLAEALGADRALAAVLVGEIEGLPAASQRWRIDARNAGAQMLVDVLWVPFGFVRVREPTGTVDLVTVARAWMAGGIALVADWLLEDDPDPEVLARRALDFNLAIMCGVGQAGDEPYAAWGPGEADA